MSRRAMSKAKLKSLILAAFNLMSFDCPLCEQLAKQDIKPINPRTSWHTHNWPRR